METQSRALFNESSVPICRHRHKSAGTVNEDQLWLGSGNTAGQSGKIEKGEQCPEKCPGLLGQGEPLQVWARPSFASPAWEEDSQNSELLLVSEIGTKSYHIPLINVPGFQLQDILEFLINKFHFIYQINSIFI